MRGAHEARRDEASGQADRVSDGRSGRIFVRVPPFALADAVGATTAVRPGRGRNRVKTGLDEKVKKPAEGGRKKPPAARKAPARGRYVDEYARPAG